MFISPWQAGAMLLALAACAAPPAETPAAALPAAVESAPGEAAAPQSAAPDSTTRESTVTQPAAIEPAAPAAIEPATPEPPLDPETQAIIETAMAALSPPRAAAAEAPVIEAAPEPDVDDDPERLIGLAGGALAELLGDPGFRRQDADAQVWQYRGRQCLLDVYLYRDGEETPHRVTYYEFRGDGGGRPCLRDLLLAQAR